jgi:hypothetical protein
LSGSYPNPSVASVGGQTAGSIASGVQDANAATVANTPGTIVKRDASGNFATGTITLGGDPVVNLQAATKQYVDSLVPSGFSILGSTSIPPPGFTYSGIILSSPQGWTTKASMPTARYNLGVAALNNLIYAIGGYVPYVGSSTENEQYTPIGYVPEFSSSLTLSLFMIATLLTGIIYKRKSSKARHVCVG